MSDYEKELAIYEAEMVASVDSFFDARPSLLRNRTYEYLVENGFRLGWNAKQEVQKGRDEADGGWIPFTATEDSVRPVAPRVKVFTKLSNGSYSKVASPAGLYLWGFRGEDSIVAYKVEG